MLALAADRVRTVRGQADAAASADRWDHQRADRFRVEIYKKNSIALACLVGIFVTMQAYVWPFTLMVVK